MQIVKFIGNDNFLIRKKKRMIFLKKKKKDTSTEGKNVIFVSNTRRGVSFLKRKMKTDLWKIRRRLIIKYIWEYCAYVVKGISIALYIYIKHRERRNDAFDDRHTSFFILSATKYFSRGIFSKEKKNRLQRYKFFRPIKKSRRNFSNLSPVGNKSSKIESIFFSYNRNIHFATHCALIYARQRAIRFKKEKRETYLKSNIIVRIKTYENTG